MEKKERKLNININDGDEFFAQEASITYNPSLFNIDFRRITSRVDMRSNDTNVIVLKHNVIMLEPYVAKKIHEILGKAIEKYENEFDEIKTPLPVQKMEEKLKKKIQEQGEKTKDNTVNFVSPNYFG